MSGKSGVKQPELFRPMLESFVDKEKKLILGSLQSD